MSGQSTPAGWYPDPQAPGQERYWDGSSWSEATRPAQPAAPPPPPLGGYAPPGAGGYGQPGGYAAPPAYGAPAGYGMAMGGTPPPNYLAVAILTTLFCCLPAGIVSIVKSTQVNTKWNVGDVAGAQKASKDAKTWASISAGVGVVVLVIYIIAVAAAGSGDSSF